MRAVPRVAPRDGQGEVAGELARLREDRDLAIDVARAALELADTAGAGPVSTARLREVLDALERASGKST